MLLTEPQSIGSAPSLCQLSDRVCAVVSEGQLSAEAVDSLRAAAVEALRASSFLRRDEAALAAACRMVEAFLRSGYLDCPVSPECVARSSELCSEGWGGLLAAALAAPAWQVTAAPRLSDAPLALWPVLTEWLFRLPVNAEFPGQVDAMSKHYVRRLRELVAVAEANRGSVAVGAALERYARSDCASILAASTVDLRELVTLRGKALGLVHRITKSAGEPAISREGRRLRVGFVLESTAESTEVRFALPWLEWLDGKRFEVVLFSNSPVTGEREAELSGLGWELRSLSGSWDGGVSELTGANLDVAVFFVQPLQSANTVARLSLHRLAPLQICLQEQGLTAGWPGSDLHVVVSPGEAARPWSAAAERIAVLPYAGIPFVRNQGRPASTCTWSREALGVDGDAVVLASVAPFKWVTPEVVDAWTRILREAPKARFLVYSYSPDDRAPGALNGLCALVTAACAIHGVEPTRFILSNESFPSLAEVLELLRLADLYVDTFPAGSIEGCQLALEVGLPVLGLGSAASFLSNGSDLCAAMGLGSWVCTDERELVSRAVSLAQNAEQRNELASALAARLATPDHVHDPVAWGEAWGALIEKAFDVRARSELGWERNDRSPITVVSDEELAALKTEVAAFSPNALAPDLRDRLSRLVAANPSLHEARLLLLQDMIRGGDHKRACAALLGLVDRLPQRAEIWFHLGQALVAEGNRADSLEALRTSLRIDASNVDAWLVLASLALDADAASLRSEIREVLLALAPNDVRVTAMASRLQVG